MVRWLAPPEGSVSSGVMQQLVTLLVRSTGGEDVATPAPYPQEFRDDVVAVARGREPGTTLKQVAKDFGIAEATLTNWMKAADVEEHPPRGHRGRGGGAAPAAVAHQAGRAGERGAAPRGAYLSQANLKLGGSGK